MQSWEQYSTYREWDNKVTLLGQLWDVCLAKRI